MKNFQNHKTFSGKNESKRNRKGNMKGLEIFYRVIGKEYTMDRLEIPKSSENILIPIHVNQHIVTKLNI